MEMQIEDKTKEWKHRCGCIIKKQVLPVIFQKKSRYRKEIELDETAWLMDKPCKQHEPDFKKRADKLIKKMNKKRGKGFTKSGHRTRPKRQRH